MGRHLISAPPPGEAGADITLELPALRAAVWTDPVAAARMLRRRIDTPAPGDTPTGHVDTAILLAEALLRSGDPAAVRAASQAVSGAALLDPARLPPARLVAVDILELTGDPDAVPAYTDYLTSVAALYAPDTDPPTVLARTGTAIAVYHDQSCRRGRRLLSDLLDGVRRRHRPGSPLVVAVTATLRMMRAGCSPSGYPPARRGLPPPPIAGGVLHPDHTRPPAGLFEQRIGARRGRHHDCDAPRTARQP